MAIVYQLSFRFLAMPFSFFLDFFLHFTGSIFSGTGVINPQWALWPTSTMNIMRRHQPVSTRSGPFGQPQP